MFNPPTPASSEAGADQSQLLRLNVDFLQLLVGMPGNAVPSLSGLRSELITGLTQCGEAGLQRMAACGFSLFSLSLHRADLWQQAAAHCQARAHEPHYGDEAAPRTDAWSRSCSGFMECALFFAWHLAQQQPHQARLFLGMSEDCTAIITGLELWQCRHIAQTRHALLGPRWRHHPYFWADLLKYGRSGDQQHFRFAQLLGSQLMAQELEPSAILRLSSTDPD